MTTAMEFQELRPAQRGSRLVLQIEELVVRVGLRRVIDGLNLEMREGQQLALLGPNGCGKSSLLNAIAGLEPAVVESGTIRFADRPLGRLSPDRRMALGISYMRQRDNVFGDLTVRDNLIMALGRREGRRLADAEEVGPLDELERRGFLSTQATATTPAIHGFPNPNTRAGALSGGERQILAWAMATLRPHTLLLADEPEAGLSRTPSVAPGVAAIIVTHRPSIYQEETT